ncbi:hypothetical protein D3C80_1452690 [compost metagenome]
MGGAGQQVFDDALDQGEGQRHHGELQPETALRVEELRQEGAEEQDHLGVGQGREQALAVQQRAGFYAARGDCCQV